MRQKTADVLKTLETGVKNLLNSDNYKNYLQYMSSFPNYSYRNSLLIYIQCREQNFMPTLLAPYREWQKRHRHVRRGQHGIAIIAPHYVKKSIDDVTERDRLGFHVAYTYDVSQTDPDDDAGEVPEICHRLTGELPDADLLKTITSISPVPVTFKPVNGEANGYYNPTICEIVVDNTNSQMQQVKTLIHEIAHCWHSMIVEDEEFNNCPHAERELVAESCAYCVCSNLAIPIDSSDYSFGYIASYSHQDQDLKKFRSNLTLIQKITNRILSDIDAKVNAAMEKDTEAS